MFLTVKLCTYAKQKIVYLDLALNNLVRLICHKTQANNKRPTFVP